MPFPKSLESEIVSWIAENLLRWCTCLSSLLHASRLPVPFSLHIAAAQLRRNAQRYPDNDGASIP